MTELALILFSSFIAWLFNTFRSRFRATRRHEWHQDEKAKAGIIFSMLKSKFFPVFPSIFRRKSARKCFSSFWIRCDALGPSFSSLLALLSFSKSISFALRRPSPTKEQPMMEYYPQTEKDKTEAKTQEDFTILGQKETQKRQVFHSDFFYITKTIYLRKVRRSDI